MSLLNYVIIRCLLGNFRAFFLSSIDYLSKSPFSKISLRNTIKVSNSWIQIWPGVSSGLLWVQSVCKGYQQTPKVGKELRWLQRLHVYIAINRMQVLIYKGVDWTHTNLRHFQMEDSSFVGHPEPGKICLHFFSTFWHPCSKCFLMYFKNDRVDSKFGNVPKFQN